MARVVLRTDQGRAKRPRFCQTCREPIVLGDRYYKWAPRTGPRGGYFQHQRCGYPRPSQLSSAKTARVHDELHALDTTQWSGSDLDELMGLVEHVAAAADEVADEYEEGVDSAPSHTGEAMQDVADRLHEYAEAIRNFSPSVDREDAQSRLVWRDMVLDELGEILDDVPEYEG